MSVTGAPDPPLAGWGVGLFESLENVDRREREAIERDDWVRLEQVLEEQTALWKRLARIVQQHSDERARITAAAGLRRLYEIRSHNHSLIEHRTKELRKNLVESRQASLAGRTYTDISRASA